MEPVQLKGQFAVLGDGGGPEGGDDVLNQAGSGDEVTDGNTKSHVDAAYDCPSVM